ncbi:Suppressor of Profilin deletion [Sporothrix stenoceras]|uniref:Suppressor of Profilin deletion n=1 Tax=Sporothrix stenoceras TaxID=5173 RepID=A0ABR3YZM1_9PEZI
MSFDALQRKEYPLMLPHLQPSQAVQMLQERVRHINKVNTDVADFFAERRKVEELYVQGLRKLVTSKGPTPAELGIFQPAWDSLLRSTDAMSKSHHQLSSNVQTGVEVPLRAFHSSNEMANITTLIANLQTMAKEVDDSSSQMEKVTKKAGKASASKVEAAIRRAEAAQQQWETQSPFIFEAFQALDETRINNLRDVLTQLETNEADQATQRQSSAEAMLTMLLDIRSADEINNFSRRVIDGRPRIAGRFNELRATRQSSVAGSAAGGPAASLPEQGDAPRPSNAGSSSVHQSQPEQPQAQEAQQAQQLQPLQASQQLPPQTPPATAGGAASATSAAPSPAAPQQLARSTTGSSSVAGSSFAAAGGAVAAGVAGVAAGAAGSFSSGTPSAPPSAPPSRQATFKQQPPSAPPSREPTFKHPPPPPTPDKKSDKHSKKAGQSEKPEEKTPGIRSRIGTILNRRRQSVHGGFGQIGSTAKNSFGRLSNSSHGQSISPRSSYNNLNETSTGNRLGSVSENQEAAPGSRDGATNGVSRGTPSRQGTASTATGGGVGGLGVADSSTLNNMTVDEIFGVSAPPGPPPSQQRSTGNEPARDAEGYSVPAAANDPISQAQRDAAFASAGEQLGGGGEGGDDQAFKVNIQNEPVQEEDPRAKEAALSNVASTLSMGMPTRKTGTVRGRRDVRNTIYMPQTLVPELSSSSSAAAGTMPTPTNLSSVSRSSTFNSFTATPTRPGPVAALASETSLGGGTSDTQSVRSATSLNALANVKHIDSSGPGLHASIIEAVSASFEHGEVTSAKIAGEIAFSYTAPPASHSTPSAATVTIRMNNFPLLEAIGPNRIFVQNTSSSDQFTLDTSHLQHKATAAFTFRAHAENDTSLAAHCPVQFKPTWTTAKNQLRLILQYRLNPSSRLAASGEPVVLRNVMFKATYDGQAISFLAKPTATHFKDKHFAYWRLGEVTLTSAWSRITCIVKTEEGAPVPKPGHLEARWEYLVPDGVIAEDDATTISISQLQPASSTLPEEDEEEKDPFADDSVPSPEAPNGSGSTVPLWTIVPTSRQFISGEYVAK